jgi:hypothetical protein
VTGRTSGILSILAELSVDSQTDVRFETGHGFHSETCLEAAEERPFPMFFSLIQTHTRTIHIRLPDFKGWSSPRLEIPVR